MRNKLIITIFALFLAGCASPAADDANNSGSTGANTEQAANAEQVVVPKNTETGENIALPGITAPPDNSNIKIKAETYDTSKATDEREAIEDSTFSTKLTDVAVETRTFKNHPTLAKVERITDAKGRTIKVYLRSGKVIEIPGNNIANLSAASSTQIMRAAGIEQPQPVLPPKPKSLDPKYSKQQ